MASSSSSSSHSVSLLDSLYCEEDEQPWEETAKEQQSLFPILLLKQDLLWEDEELSSLFSKEQQICTSFLSESSSSFLSLNRREVVEWMLKVNSYFDFSTLTAILSINYLDRFLSRSHHLQQEKKPWMIQLAAVACLSLAAKVEEIHVPLLLDLQVEGTKYAFEAKTIQKMELLVLSTLDWKMNPVTPISFLDHIIRRLGLRSDLRWEFLRRSEQVLLSIVTDWRLVGCLASEVATATMMHVIDQLQPSNPVDYHKHLLALLNITKEKVKQCYDLIVKASTLPSQTRSEAKRKRSVVPRSPNGVIDGYNFSSDSSSNSWTVTRGGLSRSSSVSSSADQRVSKKNRVYEQHMPLRFFLHTAGTPRY